MLSKVPIRSALRAFRFARAACTLALVASLGTGCPSSDSGGPASASLPVQLQSLTLVTYDTSTATINAQGTLNTSNATSLTVVRFYTDSQCASATIGAGTSTEFSGAGIPLTVSSTAQTTIYAQTNTDSFCAKLTTYTPSHPAPPPATLTSTVPTSPSHVSFTPIVFGTVSSTTTQVWLFNDSHCSNKVGSGPGSTFSSTGIAVTLTPNTTSTIYDETVEPFGNASACTALTTYTHSVLNPGAPVFGSVAPPSPSNTSTTPTIAGTLSSTSIGVTLYSDSGCQTTLASGSSSVFATGIQVTVSANATTTIYGQSVDSAGNLSPCTYLTTFVNTTTAPGAPSYTLVNPVTPTRLTIYPLVVGTAATGTAQVKLFSGTSCTQQIGTGTAAQFATPGIRASVTGNATTSIYAEDVDAAGNASPCTHMVDYTNNTIPPDPPAFSTSTPVSPNNVSYTPYIIGTTSSDTVSLKLFSDSNCQVLIGLGTTAAFTGTGVQITAGVNVATSIYALAYDDVGNQTACTFLTTYAYSNLPAPAPTFSSTSPTSPSNASTTPFVLGTAASTVSTIQLFSDSACGTEIGHGSRIAFATIGLQATVAANTNTSLYAIATDIYGNTSPCVFLADYLHDNIPPPAPTYTATSPVSPNNASGTPTVTGLANSNPASLLTVNSVTFYDSPACVNELGSGTPAQFAGAGITANVYLNADTSIYARSMDPAGNTSPCTYLADYVYDTLSPGKPVFTAANPASPSYSQLTFVTGAVQSSTDIEPATTIGIYSDSACSLNLGAGTVTAFEGSGIAVTAPENATTTFYGQVADTVGNKSSCRLLTSFQEADNGPAGFAAAMNPDGSVNLTWTPDGIARPTPTYIVQRSLWTGGPYTVIAQGVNGNSYRDASTSANATYYYVVAATNSTGTSHNSTEASVAIAVGAPGAPTALVATPGPAQVSLNWGGTPTIMTYTVYRATRSGGPYTAIATGVPSTTYTDTTASNGTPYFYVVAGVNPSGQSAYSNEASTVAEPVPSAPTDLVATPVISLPQCTGNAGVVLVWSAPSYYNQFNIKRSNTSGGESVLATVSSAPYYDCAPSSSGAYPNGTPNYYVVTGTWGALESTPSNEVEFINGSAASVAATAGNGVGDLAWSAVTTATGYNVLRSTTSGGPYTVLASNIPGTSYVDNAVANGTTYYYVIDTLYAGNVPGWPSTEVNLTPGVNPSAPSDLVIRISSNEPVLAWVPPANFNSFNIYRAAASGGPYSVLTNVASPTFQDPAPPSGMNWYKVTALWGGTETSATNTVSFRNGVPSGVTATPAASSITVAWNALAGVQHYTVWRATSSGGPYTSVATPTTTSYIDNGVTAGTGYFYVIQGSFADGTTGQYSNQVSAMPGSGKVPSGLTVTLFTANSVTVAWAAVASATSYKLYYSATSGGPWTLSGSSTQPTGTVIGLTSAKTYYFVATSVVSGTESAKSSQISQYTAGAPSAPLTTAGNAQVALSWSAVPGAVSYTVLRSTDTVSYTAIQSGLSSTSYTDSAVSNGTLYTYEVTAVFASTSQTSLASTAAVPGIVPLAPSGITVVNNADGMDVTLTWGDVPAATSYNIYQSTTNGGPYGSPVTSTSSSSANLVSGLSAGVTYYFVVTALIGSEESSYSPQIAIIPASTPPAPSVVAGPSSTATISWGAVAGASTYNLLRSPDGVNFTVIATGLASSSYSDSGLTSGNAYIYEYLPISASGVAMALSASSPPVTPGVTALPPSLLTAVATGTIQVALSWVPSPNVATYNIYRGTTTGGPYTQLTSVPSTTTSDTDTTVTAGNSYFYVVSSVNASGVISSYSNEASVSLVTGPTGLTATAVDNQINLSWNPVGGATSYTVTRALSAAGPFGTLMSGLGTTSYSDTQVAAGATYYYRVSATLASGVATPDSATASATGIVFVSLQVPIEMTDEPLASTTSQSDFLRTQTTLDPTAYDGTDTFWLDVVAINTDSSARAITLYDPNSVACATLTVPANTTVPTRIRASVTPDANLTAYTLALDGTSSAGELQVLSARMLVNQTGATRTRLYIPLLSSFYTTPSSGDSSAPVASTSAAGYAELPSAIVYNRNTSVLSSLSGNNAWALETVTAASGGATGTIGLYDTTRSAELPDTQTDFASATPEISFSPFDEGITDFAAPTNEGDNYELELTCTSDCTTGGSVQLYRAGLWVNLEPLTSAEIIFRDSLGASGIASTTTVDLERTMVDLTLFTNPLVYFQGVAQVGAAGSASLQLMSDSSADSGTSALSAVTGSGLTFNGAAKSRQRTSSPLTITTGNRFLPQIAPNGGAAPALVSASIVIDVSH